MSENIYVEVRGSKIHSRGVFAKCNILKGTRVIEYVGKKLTKKEAEVIKDPRYLFEINSRYDIDGNYEWNWAGFINHSCKPNCEPENIKGKIWIIATKNIKMGEELSYNYGYDYGDYLDWPCHCAQDKCVGYIVAKEHWPKIKRMKKLEV